MLPLARFGVIAVIASFALTACGPRQPIESKQPPLPIPRKAAQEKIVRPALDKSPMDMIYFPVDYPVLKMSGKTNELPVARVIYSRPEKDGRVIFGSVVKFGERWRLGANEATEIEFFTDVVIQDKKVKKGRYILYCVPFADRWNILLNGDLYVWGLKIHSSKDLYSFNVPVSTTADIFEVLTMEFVPQGNGMLLTMAWDNTRASLPINF